MATDDALAGSLWGADEAADSLDRELSGDAADPPEADATWPDNSKAQRSEEPRHLDGADYLSRHLDRVHAPAAAGRAADAVDAPPKAVYVSGLTWWTTDAELEALAATFGRVEGIKFFEDKVSGKSKGYALVEFATHEAATACKEGIQGHALHGKQPVVTFPSQSQAGGAAAAGGRAQEPDAAAAQQQQQRWPGMPQGPPGWQAPPGAGRGAPPPWAGGPGPDWRGPPPGMVPPFAGPPWAGRGRGAPFVRPPFGGPLMGMMPGFGPMPGGMMPPGPGFGPQVYGAGAGRDGRPTGERNGEDGSDEERGKERKKRHRDDEKKEKSRRRERRSRSRSR